MQSINNPSFIRQSAAMLAAIALTAAIAAATASTTCGLWALLAGLIAFACFALFSELRFREIMQLAEEIDEVLHAGRRIDFSDYREGDLAILKNQLSKMVAALRDANTRLEQEKTALADALADISHQIRTPLTAINLMISTIENSTDASMRTRTLRELENMVDRVSWLVTALLKLAKVDAGALHVKQTTVNAEQMAREALAPLAIAMDLRGVDCSIEADGNATFAGDAAWTSEALENVLKNCLEHTPCGGSIQVRVSEDALACRIRVTDTGPGIAPADLPHIFERFYRGQPAEESVRNSGDTHGVGGDTRKDGANPSADNEKNHGESTCEDQTQHTKETPCGHSRNPQGFGIGLALAQSLITAQGGTLHATNAPEGGAQFDITFPKLVV